MKHLIIVVVLVLSSAGLLSASDPMTTLCSYKCQGNEIKPKISDMNNYSNDSTVNSFMEVRCINWTNSSDFVLGLTFSVNAVPTSYCNGCKLPGSNCSKSIVGGLNLLRGVESLKLELRENSLNITRLPDGFLSGLADLRVVSLERIGLFSVSQNLVWGSKKIIELNLNGNNLSTLPANLLRDTQSLRKLNLSSNNIQVLPDRVFSNLKKLVSLDLSSNHLSGISKELFIGLVSLQELNLERNDLIFIETDALSSLVALQVAKFSHNKLDLRTDVYDVSGQLSPFYKCNRLKELYLSHNNITEIFSDWTASHFELQKIDLSHNSLEYIKIEDLRFVSDNIQVNLTYNTISTIELKRLESIAAELTNPRHIIIDLNFNPINCDCKVHSLLRYISKQMKQTALDFITLQVQQLKCNGPQYMKGTTLLDIKASDLKYLFDDKNTPFDNSCTPDGICDCRLRSSDQTLIIDCSARNLTEAPNRIIFDNANHVEIDLSNNSLTWAPSLEDNGYEKVRSLNLAGNQIRFVDRTMISPDLKILKLNGNKLKYIGERLLNKIANDSSITLLTLHDNPWECNNRYAALLSYVIGRYEHVSDAAKMTCTPIVPDPWNRMFNVMTYYVMCFIILLHAISLSLFFGVLVALYLEYCPMIFH